MLGMDHSIREGFKKKKKLPVLSLREVCVKFIDHLRQTKTFTKIDLTLVFHGDQDIITNFSRVSMTSVRNWRSPPQPNGSPNNHP